MAKEHRIAMDAKKNNTPKYSTEEGMQHLSVKGVKSLTKKVQFVEDSPFSDLGTLKTVRPDITIFCRTCQRYIDLRMLAEHKKYHKSLDVLKYKGTARPDTVPALLTRRNALLKKLKKQTTSEKPLQPVLLQQINDAYEFLKADLEDTYEAYRRLQEIPHTAVQGVALNCSPACVYAVGICSDGNERWKSTMEDTRVFQDYFGNDPDKCFFAIYDGHHGRFAAEVAANDLHHALLMEMEKFDPRTKCTCTFNMASSYDISQYDIHSRAPSRTSESGIIHETSANIIQQIIRTCEDNIEVLSQQTEGTKEDNKPSKDKKKEKKRKMEKNPFDEKMHTAFQKAHKYTDYLLSYGKDEQSRVRWSGASTLTCVIQSKMREEDVTEEDSKDSNEKVFGIAEVKVKEEKKKENGIAEPPKELGTIHIANAGNVEAILVRANRAYKLTKDHTPKNNKEKARVVKAGGNVSESERELRLNGILATTRGIGNHGDPLLKKCVQCEPSCSSVTLDQYAQFLVLASRGVWEVLGEEDVAHLLLQMLPQHQVPPPTRVGSSIEDLLRHLEAQSIVSDVPSDAHAVARQQEAAAAGEDGEGSTITAPTARAEQLSPLKSSMRKDLRPLTGQSMKSRASVTIKEEEEPKEGESIPEVISEELGSKKSEKASSPSDNSNNNRKVQSGKSLEKLTTAADLQLELGSTAALHSDEEVDEDEDIHDSGNEADVDTYTDGLTLPSASRMSDHVPTREELHREFAKRMSERLTQAALLAGCRDNVTVMVVLLPGSGL